MKECVNGLGSGFGQGTKNIMGSLERKLGKVLRIVCGKFMGKSWVCSLLQMINILRIDLRDHQQSNCYKAS